MNRLILYGRMTANPEMKTLPSGTVVTNFCIAESEKNKDGVEVSQFHNCISFGKTAEVIHQYHKKGDAIHIEGKVQYRSWTDKDGAKRDATEILVNTFTFNMNNKTT